MPILLIDDNEKLLIQVYPGKDKQSGQKGRTCSFYAEQYVRNQTLPRAW